MAIKISWIHTGLKPDKQWSAEGISGAQMGGEGWPRWTRKGLEGAMSCDMCFTHSQGNPKRMKK